MADRTYRPRELSDETRDEITVGRSDLIDDAVGHIRESCGRKSKHHFLFLGPRGIGKTHLIACIGDRLERDLALKSKTTVVLFPEEPIGTITFASFLSQLVRLIGQACPDESEWVSAERRIEFLASPEDVIDSLAPMFRSLIAKQNRTVVVVVENLHELLSKQFRSRSDIGALRKFFMDNNGCLLMASALGHFDAVTSVDEPFFDFFDVQILQPLTKPQAIELVTKTANYRNLTGGDLSAEKLNPVILALHDLLNGNPRWMTFAVNAALDESSRPIGETLGKLLDDATPVYQAILADLAPQERAVLDVLAGPRGDDELPTPALVAERLSVSNQQASTLLKRLASQLRSDPNPSDGRSRLYSFRDTVLGLWLAWNSGTRRSGRLKWVAQYLERFYRKQLCPVCQDGSPRFGISEFTTWPNPYLPLTEVQRQAGYLIDFERMRRAWVSSKDQELEHLCEVLATADDNPLALTVENYCSAKEVLLTTGVDPSTCNAEIYSQKVILNFFQNHTDAMNSNLAMGIEAAKIEGNSELQVVFRQNSEYLESLAKPQSSNGGLDHVALATESASPDYFANVYVSYAWGDDESDAGVQRERVVDLLCTTLATEQIRVGRDKTEIQPGGSIQDFAKRIAQAKRIIAIISEKSLRSKYCMVYELFQAYVRCGFQRDEFQEKLVVLVLDDARPLLESDEGISELVAFWNGECTKLRAVLEADDSDSFSHDERSWLHMMEDMAKRLRPMLAAINDCVMPRGLEAIRKNNFADVLARLTIPAVPSSNDDSEADVKAISPHSARLAQSVGEAILKDFKSAALEMNARRSREVYEQSSQWIEAGGEDATKELRASVLLRMADVVQENPQLRHLNLGAARVHLHDAQRILAGGVNDPDLLALSLAVDALLERRLGDAAVAFDRLSECDHATALAVRIELLLDRGDIEQATNLADKHLLSERWAEQAAIAYIAAGRDTDAISACQSLRKPNDGLARYYRCLYKSARAYLVRVEGDDALGIKPGSLLVKQKKDIELARETIEPVIARVRSAGKIANGLERESVSVRFRISHLLGDELGSELANLLADYRPLHVDVLNAMRWGLLEAEPQLIEAMRSESEDDLDTLISCVEMDVFRLSDYVSGLDHAEQLAARNPSDKQKERLADIVFQTASFGPDETRPNAIRLMTVLVGAKHRFFAMLEAKTALEAEDFAGAEEVMRGVHHDSDPDCLSLLALALEGQGRQEEALAYLDELCEITGHPQALWRAYRAVQATKEKERAELLLQRLREFPSERIQAMELLSDLYRRRGTDEALRSQIDLLKQLSKNDPHEMNYVLNHAVALKRLGLVDESLALLMEASRENPECHQVIQAYARILVEIERPHDAFAVLNDPDNRKRFWNELEYVAQFWDIAYRTGNELAAHEATRQLHRLQSGLAEEQQFMRQITLEDLKDQIKERNRFEDDIETRVVRGELPWTLPSHINHAPLTSSMEHRTQPLRVGESVSWNARFTTYASNGFVIGTRDDTLGPQFVRPNAPSADTRIVADLASLITLYRLGLLPTVAKYFGKLLIPALYRDYEGRDSARLQPHQKSRIDQTNRLVELIDKGKIKAASEMGSDLRDVVGTDSEDSDIYLPGDLVEWLVEHGSLSAKKRDSLFKTYELPRSSRDDIAASLTEERLAFSSAAIRSLDSVGVLGELNEATRIYLLPSAIEDIRSDRYAYEHQASQLRTNREFWRLIRDTDQIEFADVEVSKDDGTVIDEAFDLGLSAMMLAGNCKLPLLVDDRAILSAASSSATEEAGAAFSTFDVIEQLWREGELSSEDALNHIRELLRWRYRFHILDADLMLYSVKQYRSSKRLVGKPLEEIAAYVQQCMLNIGLHGGNSKTEPPRSIAFELYTNWMRVAADLAILVSQDDEFTDADVTKITRWIIKYLVPNVPLNAPVEQQVSMAEHGGRIFLTHVLCQLANQHDASRSKFLIPAIGEQFGLADLSFHQTVSEVVQSYRSLGLEDEPVDPKQWRDGLAVMQRSVVRHALADRATEDGFIVDPHAVAQLEASNSLRVRVDREALNASSLDALQDPDSKFTVNGKPKGPIFFYRQSENNSIGVFPIRDLLMFQDQETRVAAINYLQRLGRDRDLISKRTLEVIKQHKRQAIAKTAKTWYAAMLAIETAMDQDWQLNLAGFRQCLLVKENDWISPYWSACVGPRVHPANTLPPEAFFACTDAEWIEKRLADLVALNDIPEVINGYLDSFKHLPLSDSFSLSCLLVKRAATKSDWSDAINALITIAASADYLAAFHACRTLIQVEMRLSKSQASKAARVVANFVDLSLSEEIETPVQRQRVILGQLAMHFARWIMFYGPQLSPDNTASLAWWLADRLSTVIAEDIESSSEPRVMAERLLKRNLANLIQDTNLIGQFSGPSTDGSFFHLNTLVQLQGGPFLFALFTEDSEKFKQIATQFEPSVTETIAHWFNVRGVVGVASHSRKDGLVFPSVEGDLSAGVEVWMNDISENQRDSIQESQELIGSLGDETFVAGLLEQFHTLDVNTQTFWLARLKHAVWQNALSPSQFLKHFSDAGRRNQIVNSLDEERLETLLAILIQLASYGDRNFAIQLPHLMFNFLEAVNVDEQKQLVVHAVVTASVIGSAFSAVERLLELDSDKAIQDQLQLELQYTDHLETIAPPWSWSRIRPLQQLLSHCG